MKSWYLPLALLVASSVGLGAANIQQANAQQWGTLSGRFVYDGQAPAQPTIQVTKDIEYCGQHDLHDESLVVGPEGGIKNVIITLYARGSVPTHPSYESSADEKVALDNKNCRFEPHVVLLRTGQTLVVGNKDAVGHNTKVDTLSNPPINPIIPANGSLEQKYQQEERLPVRVSCNIHPWMTAWLVIKDNPYMAVTDENGNFKIENLPAGGELTFQVWQEKSGYVDSVTVGGKSTEWRRGRFEMTVKPGENDLGEIKVAPAVFD